MPASSSITRMRGFMARGRDSGGRRACWLPDYVADQVAELPFAHLADAQSARLLQLAAGIVAGEERRRLLADRARDLGPEPLQRRLGLVAGHAVERAGDHPGL